MGWVCDGGLQSMGVVVVVVVVYSRRGAGYGRLTLVFFLYGGGLKLPLLSLTTLKVNFDPPIPW